MIVEETLLTEFGNQVGEIFTAVFFENAVESTLYQKTVWLSFVVAVITLGFSVSKSKISHGIFYYFFALFCITPFPKLPVGFVAVDTLAKEVKKILDSSIVEFTSGMKADKKPNNMHPGLVMEMIVASATAKLDDPELRKLTQVFIAKCHEATLLKNGEEAHFEDLFRFDVSFTEEEGGISSKPIFKEIVLDERSLENNDAFSEIIPGKNCKQGLQLVREGFHARLEEKPFKIVNSTVFDSGKNEVNTEQWFEAWKATNPPFLDYSRSLRLAISSQYEKSEIISQMGWDNDYYLATNMDSSLREFMVALGSSGASTGFAATNLGDIPGRMFDARWSASTGGALKELKEKIELLPYHLVGIRNILRIIGIFAVVSLFLQKIKLFSVWVGAWFAVTLAPSFINAARSINNAIILSKLDIEKVLSGARDSSSSVGYGVDLAEAQHLLDEFIPQAYSLLNDELTMITAISAAFVGLGWMGGMVGNGMIKHQMASAQSLLTRAAMSKIGVPAGMTQSANANSKSSGAMPQSFPDGPRSSSLASVDTCVPQPSSNTLASSSYAMSDAFHKGKG